MFHKNTTALAILQIKVNLKLSVLCNQKLLVSFLDCNHSYSMMCNSKLSLNSMVKVQKEHKKM